MGWAPREEKEREREREAVREPKYKKTRNNKKPKWEQSLCYSWSSRGKREQSLLTCTIKASFARRKCSSLFLGGQKVERAREFEEKGTHEGGFAYRIGPCHNKGHFCHERRHCDSEKWRR